MKTQISPKASNNNTIFNPYIEKSYKEHAECIYSAKPVGVIEHTIMLEDGKLYSEESYEYKTYIYHLRGYTAAYKFKYQKANFAKGNDTKCAFAFYDKSIMEIIKDCRSNANAQESLDGDIPKYDYKLVKNTSYSYLCHNLGAAAINSIAKENWRSIPREFFSSIDDSIYLFVSCKNNKDLDLKFYRFPLAIPFFWDLPIATSLYKGQELQDSSILLGTIKKMFKRAYKPIQGNRPNISSIVNSNSIIHNSCSIVYLCPYRESTIAGQYLWKEPTYKTSLPDNKTCSIITMQALYKTEQQDYDLDINVYIYSNRKNDITAFVWRSGSEDDFVKKSYLNDTNPNEPKESYNNYSYILDSLSLGAIYDSFASLSKITPENVARYVVRHLARQPIGNRSLSIEGHLLYLIGGAFYRIQEILNGYIGESKERDTQSKKGPEKLTREDFLRVQALFSINNSYIFFDSDVTYKNLGNIIVPPRLKLKAVEDERYHMENVLGIEEGSNGCKRIKAILESIISTIKKEGLEIDYVYCDIENIFNDARMLQVNRFSSRYIKLLDELEGDTRSLAKIYQHILSEVKNHPDIMSSLKSLGYYFTDDSLKDIESVPVGENGDKQMYGIANSKSYAERRNVNVWDVVMKNYTNKLFHDYIYLPVHDAFPNAVFSADSRFYSKGYLDRAELFETYLGGSLKLLGDMYSSIPLYGDHMTKGYKKLNMDNWKILPEPTLFSFFMDHINRLRVVALSSPQNHFNVFITSWNIWAYELNKELHFYKENNINGESKEEQAKNQELYIMAQKYHKELLYHTFLLNPDKAIAYFNLEPKRRKNDADDYIAIPETTYFTESYEGLQEILTNMNDVVNGCVIEPIINTMAIETEPFVITGAKIGNCNLWRLTIDTSKGELSIIRRFNDISILIGSKEILFEGAASTVINKTICGCFVKTPMDVYPAVRTRNNNYYYTNPAISIDCSKSVRDKMTFEIIDGNDNGSSNFVRLTFPYNQYTLFGALPRKHSISMRFKVTEQMFAKCILLHISALQVKEKELCFTLNPLDSKEVTSIPFQLLNVPTATKPKFNIELGDLCELKVSITILTIKLDTTDNSGTFKGVVSYSLTDITKKENGKEDYLWESGGINWEFTNKHGNQCLVDGISILEYQTKPDFLKDSGTPVLIKDLVNNALEELDITDNEEREEKRKDILMEIHNKVLDEIPVQVNDFRLYFSDHQEKLEIFRESDGRNISNISNIISNTKNDTLIGKFSWLNAENTPVTYRLVLKADNFVIKGKTYDNITDIITYPFDGRIKIERASNQLVEFIVAPNSEGYMLVKFPELAKDVLHIQWQLSTKSLLTKRWRMIGLVDAGNNKKG